MNNYEAPTIVRIGKAHELILGYKPFGCLGIDSEGYFGFCERVNDIDEGDD